MPACLVGLLFLVVSTASACGATESEKPPGPEPGLPVECHGKLHCHLVGAGGEHTGTCITFDGLHWELKFRDNDKVGRNFAHQNDKQPVVVTGTLRRVVGVERRVRWIVDVAQISAPKAGAAKGQTTVTIKGKLRIPNAVADNTPPMVLDADGLEWALDFPDNPLVENQAHRQIGQSVEVQGHVESIPDTRPAQMKICVNTLTKPAAE